MAEIHETNIGDLTHRLTLQAPTRAADGMGGFTTSWADMATVWAAWWPVSARDITAAGQTMMEHTARFRIRYRSVLKSSWRGYAFGRYFAIVSIIDVGGKRQWLDLMVKEAA